MCVFRARSVGVRSVGGGGCSVAAKSPSRRVGVMVYHPQVRATHTGLSACELDVRRYEPPLRALAHTHTHRQPT